MCSVTLVSESVALLPSGHARADRDGAAHVQAERVRVSLDARGGAEEPAHEDDGRTGR